MAWQLFEEMPERDVASWNTMIFGFAMHEYVPEALDTFSQMCITGQVKPNLISFVGVLTACRPRGLVGVGRRYFDLTMWQFGEAFLMLVVREAGVQISELLAQQILELDGGLSRGIYMILSRVYASANQWNGVGILRRLLFEKGVMKEPGCRSIALAGIVHEFLAGDSSPPRTKELYNMLSLYPSDSVPIQRLTFMSLL
ncbi:pentatricopeptide repeat-containing protein At1g59720, chloroplastic/mitochondrial-like [Aristolochia californica]|uniref:pentatricopeptide repeat-containing protein At1g59720, chloroplastic/mitochondrial-like n=1 Tax=Aristolochia californica TaxID=171875 RepID=UPI0035D5C8E6